jgi:hypothetical protein
METGRTASCCARARARGCRTWLGLSAHKDRDKIHCDTRPTDLASYYTPYRLWAFRHYPTRPQLMPQPTPHRLGARTTFSQLVETQQKLGVQKRFGSSGDWQTMVGSTSPWVPHTTADALHSSAKRHGCGEAHPAYRQARIPQVRPDRCPEWQSGVADGLWWYRKVLSGLSRPHNILSQQSWSEHAPPAGQGVVAGTSPRMNPGLHVHAAHVVRSTQHVSVLHGASGAGPHARVALTESVMCT